MSDDDQVSGKDCCEEPPQFGQEVIVTRGAGAGLTGVVERRREGQRCLIRLNSDQEGVFLLINSRLVKVVKPQPASQLAPARMAPPNQDRGQLARNPFIRRRA